MSECGLVLDLEVEVYHEAAESMDQLLSVVFSRTYQVIQVTHRDYLMPTCAIRIILSGLLGESVDDGTSKALLLGRVEGCKIFCLVEQVLVKVIHKHIVDPQLSRVHAVIEFNKDVVEFLEASKEECCGIDAILSRQDTICSQVEGNLTRPGLRRRDGSLRKICLTMHAREQTARLLRYHCL